MSNNDKDKKKIENLIKGKINAEISRIKEEKLKIKVEREKLEKESKSPWYKKRFFYQAVVAGLVAVPLIWFYVKDVALPISSREKIKLSWENLERLEEINIKDEMLVEKNEMLVEKDEMLIAKDEMLIAKDAEFTKKLSKLKTEKEELSKKRVEDLEALQERFAVLDSIREDLVVQYTELSNERDELKNKFGAVQKDIEMQKIIEEDLNAQIIKAEKQRELQTYIKVAIIEPFQQTGTPVPSVKHFEKLIPELIGIELNNIIGIKNVNINILKTIGTLDVDYEISGSITPYIYSRKMALSITLDIYDAKNDTKTSKRYAYDMREEIEPIVRDLSSDILEFLNSS